MNRIDLQKIATEKLEDANLLFQHERYSNSYYLFGYAAEIAVKARLARVFIADTIPEKKFVQDIYTHDISALIRLSGLAMELDKEKRRSVRFNAHWATVAGWNEKSRYEMTDVFAATALRDAMIDQGEGVFQWLQKHW